MLRLDPRRAGTPLRWRLRAVLPAQGGAAGRGWAVVVIAQVSAHACGLGTLLFVRDARSSWERCSGCGWFYDFDNSRARPAELIGPVVLRVGEAS